MAPAIQSTTSLPPTAATSQSAPAAGALIQSDPKATVFISQAIQALGGTAAWQAVGAATAEVTLATPGMPSRTIQWADDWSQGYDQSRRSSVNQSGGLTVAVLSKTNHAMMSPNGIQHQFPRESDIATLAVGYPASALLLSLSRNTCSFQLGRPPRDPFSTIHASPEDQVVEEKCSDPLFPTGMARITWIFSKTSGLPLQAVVPQRELLHNGVTYETVNYLQFAHVQSVSTPSSINVVRPGGSTGTLSLSKTAFASSLPATTFTLSPKE